MLKAMAYADSLADLARQAAEAAGRSASMPILSHVLLEGLGARIRVTATDLEVTWQGTVAAEGFAEGRAAVPGRLLAAALDGIAGVAELTLRPDGTLAVDSQDAAFAAEIWGLSADDFPRVDPASGKGVSVAPDALSRAVDRALWAAGERGADFNCGAVCVGVRRGRTYLAATDGRNLSCVFLTEGAPGDPSAPREHLISRRGAARLKALAGLGLTVEIACGTGKLAARAGSSAVILSLLDGRFPDWERMLPGGPGEPEPTEVKVDRVPALKALSRAGRFADRGRGTARFAWDGAGPLRMGFESPLTGRLEQPIPARAAPGGARGGFSVDLEMKALESALKTMRENPGDDDSFRLSYHPGGRPAVVRSAVDEDTWTLLATAAGRREDCRDEDDA
ncbi:MAG: DNA polymerase III subunit beta [Deltaproteobacteria bacterium]|jgi:DNA polymerase-3 subunit beta|nr:DNA polymerase III subunit beta [Deltaproteobacteria bacterium]